MDNSWLTLDINSSAQYALGVCMHVCARGTGAAPTKLTNFYGMPNNG